MSASKLSIYDIKRLSESSSPFFFDRKSMKFFGQTMKDFSVKQCDDGRYYISAPRKIDGRICGYTERFFNPETNKLDLK